MSDEYATVVKGKLKLKSDSGVGKKKKKNKNEQLLEQVCKAAEITEKQVSTNTNVTQSTKTKAEQAFQKMQEKMQKERIAQKAGMTHKERVEKFNQHLDSLTEHFDIPKVSWTK